MLTSTDPSAPHLQANKSVDSFFDLLVGRTSYNINGITIPLQARLLDQMLRRRVIVSVPYAIAMKAAGVHCGACKWGWKGATCRRTGAARPSVSCRGSQMSVIPQSVTNAMQGAYVITRSDNHPVAGELRGQLSPAVFKLTSSSSSS